MLAILESPYPAASWSSCMSLRHRKHREFQIKWISPPSNLLFFLLLIYTVVQAKILISPQTPSYSLLIDSCQLIRHEGR